MTFLRRANRTPIDARMLAEANALQANLSEDDRHDSDALTMALIRMLRAKGMDGDRRRDVLLAIQFRMEALAQLSAETHPEMQAWTLKGEKKGLDYVQEVVLEAAVREPIIEIDGQAAFNPQSFFARLLGLSGEHGRA